MEYIAIWIIGCMLIGWIGSKTKLGFWSAALLSLILSPIIGFIIVLLYPEKKKEVIQKDIASIQAKLQQLEDMKLSNKITEKEYTFLRNQVING